MIYVASTFNQRAIGFQYRSQLEENEAMIFKGVGPGASFHMRNVATPLVIASLDDSYKVMDIGYMEPDTGTYISAAGSEHVLEASPGFFKRHGIAKGAPVCYTLDRVGYGTYDWNHYVKLAEKKGRFGEGLL